MNSADILTSFFNNELSPEQERQFLLSVASSDAMRLDLKSHVMLDKMLGEDSRAANVSPEVRKTILKQAAVVAGTASIDVSDAAGKTTNGTEGLEGTAPTSGPSLSSFAGFTGWVAIPFTLLVAVAGFFFGYQTGNDAVTSDPTPVVAVDETAADDVIDARITPRNLVLIAGGAVPVFMPGEDVAVSSEVDGSDAAQADIRPATVTSATTTVASNEGQEREDDASSSASERGSGTVDQRSVNSGNTEVTRRDNNN